MDFREQVLLAALSGGKSYQEAVELADRAQADRDGEIRRVAEREQLEREREIATEWRVFDGFVQIILGAGMPVLLFVDVYMSITTVGRDKIALLVLFAPLAVLTVSVWREIIKWYKQRTTEGTE